MTRTTILSRCYPSSNNHSYASLSRYILNSIPLSTVALTTQRKLSTSRQRVLSSTYDSMIHLSSSVNSGATSRQLRWCSKKRTTSFSIDRSGLLRFDNIWPTNDEILRVSEKKEPPTPLVEQLRNIIKVRGPITVHDYMAQVTITVIPTPSFLN